MKAAERIARMLANEIIEADLPRGTRLPAEKEMLGLFGVGRATLREALRLLEAHGVITIRPGPGGGPVVRRPEASDLGEALQLILQFQGVSLAEVLEARDTIEPAVAALATTRMTAAQIDVLRSTLQTILDNLDDHELFLVETQRFQSTIADASGNAVLRIFQDALMSVAQNVVADVTYTRNRRKMIAEAYGRLVEGFVSGDPAKVSEITHDYIAESRKYWRRRFSIFAERRITWQG
jgi:GntR family transcriptional regulator, transcriptional repressor for pyruvate dehydrogenase complex